METHDGMITWGDIKAVRRRIGEAGWGDAALEIFDREPVLGKCVAHHWTRIASLLENAGVTPEQSRPALRQLVKMVVEALELKSRGQSKLLAGVLPGFDDEEGGNNG